MPFKINTYLFKRFTKLLSFTSVFININTSRIKSINFKQINSSPRKRIFTNQIKFSIFPKRIFIILKTNNFITNFFKFSNKLFSAIKTIKIHHKSFKHHIIISLIIITKYIITNRYIILKMSFFRINIFN